MALGVGGFSFAKDFSGQENGREPKRDVAINQFVNTLSYRLAIKLTRVLKEG